MRLDWLWSEGVLLDPESETEIGIGFSYTMRDGDASRDVEVFRAYKAALDADRNRHLESAREIFRDAERHYFPLPSQSN